MVEHVLSSVRYGSAAGCSRPWRGVASGRVSLLDQGRSALDKLSGFSPDIYIPLHRQLPPPFFFFTSLVTHDSPLVHLCIPSSNLRDLNAMGLLTLFRIVCYLVLVGPRSTHVWIPTDPDMLLSGCLRLARWG